MDGDAEQQLNSRAESLASEGEDEYLGAGGESESSPPPRVVGQDGPALLPGELVPTDGMSAEMRFQLEMRRMEIAAEAEERRARRQEKEKEKERMLEKERLEVEKEKLKKEEREKRERLEFEREQADKTRVFEMEKLRMTTTSPSGGEGGVGRVETVESQMVRSRKLVPEFDEKKVTEWFRRFEKKAMEFEWPANRWVGLVVSALKGKALEVYDRMSVEDLASYEEFKADILRAYELRPEAYRLQFRESRKKQGDSYLECARYMEETFDKWMASERADTYQRVRELLVLEQFVNGAERDIATRLKEKRFTSLKEAATWADDVVLARKGTVPPGMTGGGEKGGKWGNGGGSGGSFSGPRRSGWNFNATKGAGSPYKSRSPPEQKKPAQGSVTTSTPKYNNQLVCYNCREVGHTRYNCPKLVTVTPVKPPAKPVALLVWPEEEKKEELHPHYRGVGRKANLVGGVEEGQPEMTASSRAVASLSGVEPQLAWCRPFLCKGTVEIAGEVYPVTVLRDTGAQQSLCKNLTGRKVASRGAVLCRGINTVEEFATAPVTLTCPLVTATARVAVAESLPVSGVDFLLGNDLAGGRVWVQPSSSEPVVAGEKEQVAPVSECVVTRSRAREMATSAALGSSGGDTNKPKSGLLESQRVGADCDKTEPPVTTPDSDGDDAESEDGVLGLSRLFDGNPHSAGHPGGSTQAELLPGVEAEGPGTQSGPQSGGSSGVGVTAEEGEALTPAGGVEVSSPAECTGGGEQAAPLPGDHSTGEAFDGDSPLSGEAERGEDGVIQGKDTLPPSRTCLRRASVSALPLPPDPVVPRNLSKVGPGKLIECQQADEELAPYFARVGEGSEEVEGREEFVLRGGVLYRRWREGDDGELLQVVVPVQLREALVLLAHEGPMAGHLGNRKTVARLRRNFWWPGMASNVANIIKCCHTCQIVGKPNQKPPVAPLHPIPAVDPPFTRVLIDIVGPLPTTRSGHKYLLTIMDVSTRYPAAIPLRSTHAKVILKNLFNFFTYFGLPAEVQSDRGTNFTSNLFAQTMAEWGTKHVLSSAYHPQSQGALERHHQTLKTMLRAFCYDHERDWDEAVPYVMFAVREAPTESLGFAPNELIFGHRVRGPLDVVRDAWCNPQPSRPESLLKQVMCTRERLSRALEAAQEHLGKAQRRMKGYYDKKTQYRSFAPGDEVLVLLPLQGQPLAARYSGPYVVERRVGDLDYVVATPDRRKRAQICHVNMLKPYFRAFDRAGPLCFAEKVAPLVLFFGSDGEAPDSIGPDPVAPTDHWERNSGKLLLEKLNHLEVEQSRELLRLVERYPSVFRTVPGRTSLVVHDIDVGDATPVKLPPYRVNPHKQRLLEDELGYMLRHNLIERAYSEWSSPVTLQPKPGGKVRFCVDFRKVNALTKADSYPLPRVDDSVDRIGAATFITKLDLVKGYWQVPLTERAKDIASFVANGAVYRCQVMPYGLKNAPATFQRLMDRVVDGLTHVVVYIDDVVVYDTTWVEHLQNVEALLARLHEAGLVVNLDKCEFVQARVQYLGYVVGHGCVTPPEAKVEAIRRFPAPTCRRALQRFLGVVGYYRRFVPAYSTLLAPLTALLRKGCKWEWSAECEKAFGGVKEVLCSLPVLRAPDFSRPFALAVDASQEGVGAVLMQPDQDQVNHPVCYFSKKFTQAQRNYSVIEQELLAIILALQHFEVYVPSHGPRITVYSDHSPLQFLNRFKFKNVRLTRWSLLLQEYNLEVHHVKGADNVVADCLSRG